MGPFRVEPRFRVECRHQSFAPSSGIRWERGSVDRVTDADLPHFAPWIHGAEPGAAPVDPPIQVQWFGTDTVVLRQSMASDFEAPFLYLFFGSERALLVDTGATTDAATFPLRATIDLLLTTWLRLHSRDGYELVVTHSHAHGDHIAGDSQFGDRPNTIVVGADLQSVRAFYGFGDDVDTPATFELGDRLVEVLRIPGHDPTSVAVFDPATGWLLTGDTVYPGRLYVTDAPAWIASIARLDDFASSHAVTAIMGCHIEMTTTPGIDYPAGTTWQPDEPPLPMSRAQLGRIRAVSDAALEVGRHVFDDFIIEPK